MAFTLKMDEFIEMFEDCTLGSLQSDEEVGLDPDTIYDDAVPESVKNHCLALKRKIPAKYGVPDTDYIHHAKVLANIYENHGLVPLVLCTVICQPSHIFSLDFDSDAFTKCWKRIGHKVPKDVITTAEEYELKSGLVLNVLAAVERIMYAEPWAPLADITVIPPAEVSQGTLKVPKDKKLRRHRSLTEVIESLRRR